jgi:ribosome-dependent ATPase
MMNFLMLTAAAVFVLGVPLTGSFWALAAAACLYVVVSTALGLVVSAFMRSQIAAIFATALLTIIPAVQFSGMVDPVSSLQGAGRLIGELYPATHFVTIARGTFSKGLGFPDLWSQILALAAAVPILLTLGTRCCASRAT